jgi:cytochrome c biogenesis protein CcmG/thiol:disulfide interchange protein DsbE
VNVTTATTRKLPHLRRALIVAAILAPAVGLLVLLGYGFMAEPKYIPSPLLGRPAARFTLRLFGGGELRLDQLRGKVVFLNFWASWCPPCRAEARELEAAWQAYKDRGVVFVGVNALDQEGPAREFIEEFGITYPNGMDPRGKITIDYGVWGLPETFFIDREGRITYKQVGTLGWSTIATKLDEAARGVVSAAEGRGEYQSAR